MVIVRGNTHWIVDQDPLGGDHTEPYGRFIFENGKIKAQVLKGVYLPKGREKEAVKKYMDRLNQYLDPIYVGAAPKSRPISKIETLVSPEEAPEQWLQWLSQAFRACSDYEMFDEANTTPLDETKYLKENSFLESMKPQ